MYKVKFIDVGTEKMIFTVDYSDKEGITDKELANDVKLHIPGADVRCHDGAVLFGNGHPGCYVRQGSYSVEEVTE